MRFGSFLSWGRGFLQKLNRGSLILRIHHLFFRLLLAGDRIVRRGAANGEKESDERQRQKIFILIETYENSSRRSRFLGFLEGGIEEGPAAVECFGVEGFEFLAGEASVDSSESSMIALRRFFPSSTVGSSTSVSATCIDEPEGSTSLLPSRRPASGSGG